MEDIWDDYPIDELNLREITYLDILATGITMIGELKLCTYTELEEKFSREVASEVQAALAAQGLRLKAAETDFLGDAIGQALSIYDLSGPAAAVAHFLTEVRRQETIGNPYNHTALHPLLVAGSKYGRIGFCMAMHSAAELMAKPRAGVRP